MTGLIKEELLSVIKKKRFIILTAAAFIGAVVTAVLTKNIYWNDLTYFLALQNYISTVFTPLAGFSLILSVYRKKYTRSSILQTEEYGTGRVAGVMSRFISGSVILIACYAVMVLLVLLMGLVLGAHTTAEQAGAFAARLVTDCAASIAMYSISLFWLYLFAFPAVPVLLQGVLMIGIPYIAGSYNLYDIYIYRIGGFIVPKLTGDIAYADLVLANPRFADAGFFLLQITVPLLFAMLVFRLKKLKPDKEPEVQPS